MAGELPASGTVDAVGATGTIGGRVGATRRRGRGACAASDRVPLRADVPSVPVRRGAVARSVRRGEAVVGEADVGATIASPVAAAGGTTGGSRKRTYSREIGAAHPTLTTSPIAGS